MELKCFISKSFFVVLCLKVLFLSDNEVVKGIGRVYSGSCVIFLDENGNENKIESKEIVFLYGKGRNIFKEVR